MVTFNAYVDLTYLISGSGTCILCDDCIQTGNLGRIKGDI
jgi:hypothetical protein